MTDAGPAADDEDLPAQDSAATASRGEGLSTAASRGKDQDQACPMADRRSAGAKAAKVWLRRLFTDPVSGVLTQRDPRRRLFNGSLRAFLIARDRTCRNAWCGAPIRHIDHITRHTDAGDTVEDNGRGLCAHCNLTRERPRHLDPPPETFRPPPPLLPVFPRQPGAP